MFVLVVYVVLGVWVSDSRVLVLVNSYLFVGVLSNIVLLRYKLLHTGYYAYSLFLYVLFVFLSGAVWLLSVSSIIGVLRIGYGVCRFVLKCLWVAGLVVGVLLFTYSTLHYQFDLYMLLLVALPALVVVLYCCFLRECSFTGFLCLLSLVGAMILIILSILSLYSYSYLLFLCLLFCFQNCVLVIGFT